MRVFAGAFAVAVVAILLPPLAHAEPERAEIVQQGDLSGLWFTQEWSQRGGDPANLRIYESTNFSVPDYISDNHSINPAQAWQRKLWIPPQPDQPYPYSAFPTPNAIYGEPVTNYIRSLNNVLGPFGVMALSTEDGLYVLTTAAFPNYNKSQFGEGPFGDTDLSWRHRSLVGPPVILGDYTIRSADGYNGWDSFDYGYAGVITTSSPGEDAEYTFFDLTVAGATKLVIPTTTYFGFIDFVDEIDLGVPTPASYPIAFDGFLTLFTAHDNTTGDWTCRYDKRGTAGFLQAISLGTFPFAPVWTAPLMLGGCGSNAPGAPPSDAVLYTPTTSPVVCVCNGVVVIGVESVCSDTSTWVCDNFQPEYRLFAFSTSGVLLWTKDTESRVQPHPVALNNLIVYATNDGKAHAIDYSGNILWSTQVEPYLLLPWVDNAWSATVEMYGPAVDSAGGGARYAYFGGSDGRVHRFQLSDGSHEESAVPWYHVNPRNSGLYQACTITSAPALYQDEFLVVKCHTRRQSSTDPPNPPPNTSCLMIMSLPDMTFEDAFTGFNPDLRVDAEEGVFRNGGSIYGGIWMNNFVGGFTNDPVKGVDYLDWAGINGYDLATDNSDDAGGVSISNGFVYASDRGGNLIAIPSAERFVLSAVDMLGPAPGSIPPSTILPPLGEIQVYPNPFNPLTAVGGTAKFKNLPEGSTVTLYTLAYERVQTLTASNHQAFWDGRNESGQEVATGVYLYKILQPGKAPITGRLALVRK